jgi:hypothetical protein
VCIQDCILKIDGEEPGRWNGGDKPDQREEVILELERNGVFHTLNLKRSNASFFSAFELALSTSGGATEDRMQRIWLDSV